MLEPRRIAGQAVPVVLNAASAAGHSSADVAVVRAAFREAGVATRLVVVKQGESLREAAAAALAGRPPILVAAGGDGTVSTVADAVRGTPTALGVLPVGTLNHFARDLGLPLDLPEAARVIAAGKRASVDVGEVNGRAFINNASLGLYADLVRSRTRQQRRLRRSKRTAMLWALYEVLDRSPLMHLRLEYPDRAEELEAPFVFIGNNDYDLEGFRIGTRARLDAGMLNAYTTRRRTAGGLVALALRALCGRLSQADDFLQTSVRGLRVESRRRRLVVAIDGELFAMDTPLQFRVRPRSLQVIVP